MKVLIFQHTPEEAPGTLLNWLERKGLEACIQAWYLDSGKPEIADFAWLIILGGPMNVNQENEYPWLRAEKETLQAWLQTGKPVLGICLGGQLLAQALGGSVTRNPQREIGFFKVQKTGAEHPALRRWPQEIFVYQYHEDTFSLPANSVNLLSSEACPRQAFAIGSHLLGLQFHPESTAEWIQENGSSVNRKEGEKFVQLPAETQVQTKIHLAPMTESFFHLLDDFWESWR